MWLNVKEPWQRFWCFSLTQFTLRCFYCCSFGVGCVVCPSPPCFFLPKNCKSSLIFGQKYLLRGLHYELITSVAKEGGWIPSKLIFLVKKIWNIDQLQVPNIIIVNLEFLTSPLVKHKQMQNVQHHGFGHFLIPAVTPKLPTSGWFSCILRVLHCAASRFRFEELYLTYNHSRITLWALYSLQ